MRDRDLFNLAVGIVAAMFVGFLLMAVFAAVSSAQTPRTAKVSWGAVNLDVEGNPITGVVYHLYRSVNGASFVRVQSNLTALTFEDAGLPPGRACYKLTAQTPVNPESEQSEEGCKSFPFPRAAKPAAPVIE